MERNDLAHPSTSFPQLSSSSSSLNQERGQPALNTHLRLCWQDRGCGMCPRGVQREAHRAPNLPQGKPAAWAPCCPTAGTGMGRWQRFASPWQPTEDGSTLCILHLKDEPWQINNACRDGDGL